MHLLAASFLALPLDRMLPVPRPMLAWAWGWGGLLFFFLLPELFLLFSLPLSLSPHPLPAHTLSLSLNPGSLSLQHCQFGHLRTCARAAPPRSSTFQRRQKKVCSDPSPPVGTLTAGTGAGTGRDEAGSSRRRALGPPGSREGLQRGRAELPQGQGLWGGRNYTFFCLFFFFF